MRSLEQHFEQAIAAYTQHLVWLVELDLTSAYRYTSADLDLYYSGNKYLARGMEISPVQYQLSMAIDRAQITLDNADKSISAIIEAGEIRGKEATIRQGAVVDNVVYAEAVFIGVIDSAEYDRERARLNLYNRFIYWRRRIPRRQYSPSCQVSRFKDEFCGYQGAETWCDKSYDRCLWLGNQSNFRGFRWLPILETKELWWGKVPKGGK